MRAMNQQEIEKVISCSNWASICSVGKDGMPYAIEATPFHMDGMICFMINPSGQTWKNMQHSDKVLVKFTLTDTTLHNWAGVSCYGRGAFVLDKEQLIRGWDLLGKVMKTDYSEAAKKFSSNVVKTPLFCVTIEEKTGTCSAKKDIAFEFLEEKAELC